MCGATYIGAFALLCFDVLQFAVPAELRCYTGSMEEYTAAPLSKATQLLSSPCIDLERPTVFYTFGYRGRARGPATSAVLRAYLATNKRNVLLLDWQQEAQSGPLGLQLGYALSAVPNAHKVGAEFGGALVALAGAGLNMTRLQLVGHSLGAHLMCYAGRAARQQGYTLPRLVALDPARALFEGLFSWSQGVDRTCAKFVQVIHTDPGHYGLQQPAGTADFFPNGAADELQTLQPSCSPGDYDMFTPEDLCNHDCSWRYLVASISQPTALLAVRARSAAHWRRGDFNHTDTVYMGELTTDRAAGSYFLRTSGAPPYGLGGAGIYPSGGGGGTRPRRAPPRARGGLGALLRWLR